MSTEIAFLDPKKFSFPLSNRKPPRLNLIEFDLTKLLHNVPYLKVQVVYFFYFGNQGVCKQAYR